jgi:thiamine-monophosphate kinase
MTRLNENAIVDLFVSQLNIESASKGIKDDVVIIPREIGQLKVNLVLKCDMLVESTDVPYLMHPGQIARKSVVASVSDFAAKGVKPLHCIISVGIPKTYSKNNLQKLITGFKRVSKEYEIEIVGGDTNESKELIIDCTLVGLNYADCIPRRYGAKPGDLIVVSGKFGYTSSGLKIINSKCLATRKFRTRAISSILQPKPNFRFGFSLSGFFSSSMDSSDGLASSLYELADQSGVDFLITNLPTSKDVNDFASSNSFNLEELVFFGGEEYETVATVRKSDFNKMKLTAKKENITMHIIGEAIRGTGNVYLQHNSDRKISKRKLLKNQGFMHFL